MPSSTSHRITSYNVCYTKLLRFDNKYGYSKLFEGRVNGSDDIRMNLNGEQYNYNTQSSGMVNLNYSSPNTQLYFNSLVLNSTKQESYNFV